MTLEKACQFTINELKKSGYCFEETKSKTTNSVYYKLFSATNNLIFRISDHNTGTKIITFRIDCSNDFNNLIRFVQKRIKDLSYRSTKQLLGI